MPPSPAMRISPGRELRSENHKRGCSLERGIGLCGKEDSLALFTEVQNKEREGFLLQSNDDFDDIFSTKLKYFSDSKHGVSIPAQGESSDLLNAGDKNDYDWLITPPESPLFASLDDEAPALHHVTRGRPRSQPVSISRSSTVEPTYNGARGSPSPNRLSPSPRSGNAALQVRSMPFSASHSSPPPQFPHTSPSRMSPPPIKRTTPRSGTPSHRRMSTGSAGGTSQSRTRGNSPVKPNRGNSASPKVRAWQLNIPGFSSEAPPNLRTSLADRPGSYVRGASPASRNDSRSGRHSMSPTASRSVASSHSHERDPFSSHRKGSVASSGDDDVDSLLSNTVSSSDCSVPRNMSAIPNNRAMAFVKKPAKILSSSAPKRHFDLALRQMDRKGPQNMFRPLLSSVPSSTFHAGKGSVHFRSLTSRNSSITTSSNASSDQGTSGALDTEESEQNHDDVNSEFVKKHYPPADDEVFAMDQADTDASYEALDHRITEDREHGEPSSVVSQLDVAESSSQVNNAKLLDSTETLDGIYDYANFDGDPDMEQCSKCSQRLHPVELITEGDRWVCRNCKSLGVNSSLVPMEKVTVGTSADHSYVNISGNGSLEILDLSASVPESLQVSCAGETERDHLESISNELEYPYKELSKMDLAKSQLDFSVDCESGPQQMQQPDFCLNSQIEVSEGTGISLLLKRSSSWKAHVIQNRSYTASNTSYDDFSYVRDSLTSLRSSIGHSSGSMSSSIDLGSSRQAEAHIHGTSGGPKSDLGSYSYEITTKHKRSISSLSGASGHVFQVPSETPGCLQDSFEVIAANKDNQVVGATCTETHDSLTFECTEAESTYTAVESGTICSGDNSVLSILTSEEPGSFERQDKLMSNSRDSVNEEATTSNFQTSTQGEDARQSSCTDGVDAAEDPEPSTLDTISEMEIESSDIIYADSQSDVDSTSELLGNVTALQGDHVAAAVQELTLSTAENAGFEEPSIVSEEPTIVLEEPTIVLEESGTSRTLTLEEATDVILLCSSIVHDITYNAANIAIDREGSTPEVLRPATAFSGKPSSDERETRARASAKHSSKTHKARQKRMEEVTKSPRSVIAENEENSTPKIVWSPTNMSNSTIPPKLESKCNCTIM